jgi:pimeloyl-ACP methyl ester carboxylesterase
MNTAPQVREITLSAEGIQLSALLAEPVELPRAVVVAIHGGGMRAGYFHGRAGPDPSLLELGASLGWTVLAIDRPGYGRSAEQLPKGQRLAQQALTLAAALDNFATEYRTGLGFGVVAHSFGGKLALELAAADRVTELIGLDISGCGHRYAMDADQLPEPNGRGLWPLNWGMLKHYPPDTFRLSAGLVAPVPAREAQDAASWPDRFPAIAARVSVPVRFTFAEHERWWRHDPETIQALTGLLGTQRVVIDRQLHVGHNISLGWAARSYHLRALAFLEECVLERELAAAVPQWRLPPPARSAAGRIDEWRQPYDYLDIARTTVQR